MLPRACYDEWALGRQGGTGQTFPDSEPFLQISVGQSHPAVQLSDKYQVL